MGGQSHYDSNGDGRLSGREWSNWYTGTYGVDIELAERRRSRVTRAGWTKWRNNTLTIIEKAYSIVVSNAQAILGRDAGDEVKRCFLYWMTYGSVSGNMWSIMKATNGGMYVPDSIFYPFRALVEGFLKLHPGIVSYKEVVRAVKRGKTLFSEEASLSETYCGSFRRSIIPMLPAYHDDALPVLGYSSVFIKYDSEKDNEKVRQLSEIMEALFPMYSFFSGKFDAEGDAADNRHREIFERYWKELGKQEEKCCEYEATEEEELEESFDDDRTESPAIVVTEPLRIKAKMEPQQEAIEDDGTPYQYCKVLFPRHEKLYSYRYEDINLTPGDFITVPYGRQNTEKIGRVESVGTYTASNAPYPPKKTKMVIGKTEKPDNWDDEGKDW